MTTARLDAVRQSLSARDWAIICEVAALRLITGQQLERLHFADLAEVSRQVVRRRVLGRLVKGRVLGTLTRRIGGVRAGSQGPYDELTYYRKRPPLLAGVVFHEGVSADDLTLTDLLALASGQRF